MARSANLLNNIAHDRASTMHATTSASRPANPTHVRAASNVKTHAAHAPKTANGIANTECAILMSFAKSASDRAAPPRAAPPRATPTPAAVSGAPSGTPDGWRVPPSQRGNRPNDLAPEGP